MTEEIKQRIEMINRGEVPDGYKKTKVGIVPREWEVTEFQSISNITRLAGAEYSDIWYTDADGDIIALRGYNIGVNKLILNDYETINQQLSNRLYRSKLYVNDIVFPCVGTIGNAVLITENDKYHINQNIAKISCDNRVYPLYFVYYLMSELVLNEIYKYNATTSQPNVLVGSLRKFKAILPPLPEQEKIAEILTTQDKVIELKQKLINEKKQQKKWLMQQLLTEKKRLKGFSGEWKKVRIGLFLSESKIIETNLDINKRITVKLNLKGIEKRQTKTIESEDATIQYRRSVGQFIYGKQNLHKGAFGIIPLELNNYQSSSDIPSFDFSDNVNGLWFFYFLSRENYYTQLENIATGTGSKRIQPNEFLNISIPFPPLPEQTAIASILSTQDKEIELLEKDLEQEKQKKKALMQLLLTGKVRVKA